MLIGLVGADYLVILQRVAQDLAPSKLSEVELFELQNSDIGKFFYLDNLGSS